MGKLMDKYRSDLLEALELLYAERDRIRRAYYLSIKEIREDRIYKRISEKEYAIIHNRMKRGQQETMDTLFDKIRERRRLIDRINERERMQLEADTKR